MSLVNVLAGAQGGQCFANIARCFQITPDQARDCAVAFRPVVARHIEHLLQSDRGIELLLAAFTDPAVTAVARNADCLTDPSVRQSGEALFRQLEYSGVPVGDTIGDLSRQAHVGHQTLRALLPFLTLLFVAGIRDHVAPVFRKALARSQPDDMSTDPFEFVRDHTLRSRVQKPAETSSGSWLQQILSSTVPEAEVLSYRLDVSPERLSHVPV